MTCYNSELPIGPPGPPGPQGPPGQQIQRIQNDVYVTSLSGTPISQTINCSLNEDGKFIQFDFDVNAISSEYIEFTLDIVDTNPISLINIITIDNIEKLKGTIVIERKDSSTIWVRLNVGTYDFSPTFGDLNPIINSYYRLIPVTIDPTNLDFEFNANSTSGDFSLLITKILKYNIPYL